MKLKERFYHFIYVLPKLVSQTTLRRSLRGCDYIPRDFHEGREIGSQLAEESAVQSTLSTRDTLCIVRYNL